MYPIRKANFQRPCRYEIGVRIEFQNVPSVCLSVCLFSFLRAHDSQIFLLPSATQPNMTDRSLIQAHSSCYLFGFNSAKSLIVFFRFCFLHTHTLAVSCAKPHSSFASKAARWPQAPTKLKCSLTAQLYRCTG